jgi:hypothetical protein
MAVLTTLCGIFPLGSAHDTNVTNDQLGSSLFHINATKDEKENDDDHEKWWRVHATVGQSKEEDEEDVLTRVV